MPPAGGRSLQVDAFVVPRAFPTPALGEYFAERYTVHGPAGAPVQLSAMSPGVVPRTTVSEMPSGVPAAWGASASAANRLPTTTAGRIMGVLLQRRTTRAARAVVPGVRTAENGGPCVHYRILPGEAPRVAVVALTFS